ncbi:MAG: hypothetical protein AAFP84_14290 [Actinomycetota bacterium]
MSEPTASAAPNDSSSEAPSPIVALQQLDSEIDQLAHRRANLPESAALQMAEDALTAWEAERDRLHGAISELGDRIAGAEERAEEIGEHTTRLEAQLRTVIAPREAEALMHEIATLADERDAVETGELEALEAQTVLEDTLGSHVETEAALREDASRSGEAQRIATAAIDEQVRALTGRRDAARGEVSAGLLARYDRLRGHHQIAVTELKGRQCLGCHLDLSAAEVDDVKDEAAASGGVADCPQCGRMLVL